MRGKRRERRGTVAREAAEDYGAAAPERPLGKRARILAIVATDRTFVRTRLPGGNGVREAHVGKCLHCGARLTISLEGEPLSHATIEHILPRSHGGTDAPGNLGLACARCNAQKGVRLDSRRPGDPDLRRVVEALLTKRRERWRDPP